MVNTQIESKSNKNTNIKLVKLWTTFLYGRNKTIIAATRKL